MKKNIWKYIILIFVVCLLICSCSNKYSCTKKNVQLYVDARDLIAEKWVDADELASSTSRINLAPQINRLQEIKREASAIEPPDCLKISHNSFITYMDKIIGSYLLFMQGESDKTVSDAFEESNTYLYTSNNELKRILNCVPNCE